MNINNNHLALRIIGFSILSAVFFLCTVACSSSGALPEIQEKPPKKIEVSQFSGTWMGRARLISGAQYQEPMLITVMMSGHRATLEIEGRQPEFQAHLRPVELNNGEVSFQFDEIDAKSGLFNSLQQPISLSIVSPPGKGEKHLQLKLSIEHGISTRRIQERIVSLYPPRIFFGTGRGGYSRLSPIIYQDWRHAEHVAGALEVEVEKSNELVGIDIEYLKNKGWKCLNQVNKFVRPGQEVRLDFNSVLGGKKLYLIYSRIPVSDLVVGVAGRGVEFPSIVKSYPTFLCESFAETSIIISTAPSAVGTRSSWPGEIPVTVFQFSRDWGAYGGGCSLREFGLDSTMQYDQIARLVGKAILVYGAENIRRNKIETDEELASVLAAVARDAAIESLIQEFHLEASSDEVGYLSRWVGLIISNDLSLESLSQSAFEEWITQKVIEEKPEYADKEWIIEALIAVHALSANR